ncbi:MAG: mandelate racemase/muconate lactonizing enzyme family protein [Candidatus Latescibacterota bacterium]
MKITDLKTHVMGVPGPDGQTIRRNWIFVEVLTDAGITGLGEATTEYHEMAVCAQLESELKPRLLGLDPTDVERIWQMGYRDFWWKRGVVQTSALSGVDQALWDIAGKACGQPVFKLLGGRVRDRIRLYARPDFAAGTVAEAALQAIGEGFDAFKAGQEELPRPFDPLRLAEAEVRSFSALRQAVGAGVDLMIDCGGLHTPQSAHRLMEGLAPLSLLFVEEPLEQGTVEPYLRLKRDFPQVPLAAGERWMTRWDCRPWFEPQAIDVCQVDISHTGGISEVMRIAAFAEVYGIRLAPHNPYGPVALAAAAHAAAAMPNFLVLEHCRLRPWFAQVQRLAVPIRGGYVDVDELARRPGLGVDLDLDLVGKRPHGRLAGHTQRDASGAMPLY